MKDSQRSVTWWGNPRYGDGCFLDPLNILHFLPCFPMNKTEARRAEAPMTDLDEKIVLHSTSCNPSLSTIYQPGTFQNVFILRISSNHVPESLKDSDEQHSSNLWTRPGTLKHRLRLALLQVKDCSTRPLFCKQKPFLRAFEGLFKRHSLRLRRTVKLSLFFA